MYKYNKLDIFIICEDGNIYGIKNGNFINITNKWLKNSIPNSHKIVDAKYFKSKEGKRYYVDGKNVVLEYSYKEIEVANWIEKTFGGQLLMLPRINNPSGISTPDYLFRNEYWDLKEILSSGKRAIDNRINGTRKQTSNYILDITDNILSDQDIIRQIENIYNSNDRKWVDKIIVKRNNNLIIIFERKK